MKTITATLAALLLAGAGTAALAQDRDHERGDRGDRGQAAVQPHPMAPQGGHARPGAPPAAQAAPPVAVQQAAPARGFDRHDGQRFQSGAPAGPAPGGPAPQRFDRGGQPGQGGQRQFDQRGQSDQRRQSDQRGQFDQQRQFDRQRGPQEVIPPNGAQFDRRGVGRGDDRRGDGRDQRAGDRWNGDRHDGNSPWRHGDRWEAGRAPPVFWSQNRYRIGGYRAPYGYYVRTWGFGDFLPRGWYGQDYWIGDFINYDLPYPPPGYEWVRVGGDALMIDRYSGRIVQVVRGLFW